MAGSGGTSSGSSGGHAGTGGRGGGAGAGGEAPPVECLPAEGPGAADTDRLSDPPYEATVTVADRNSCARSYTMTTDAPLRDDQPDHPRSFAEAGGWPVLRSGHDLFDALYALALEEVRQNSVDSIQDGAFDGGAPVPCPPGGCFETGRLWTYVWTRDTAYAVLLGLGLLDPRRAKNSLEFKLSERRDGSDLQIVQDTGTGGSYPISTDRVVWAMGAWELLKYLDGDERTAFRDRAYEAMANTADHDRIVAFDPADGLYRGEQSFLDWREQSYPGWTATDPVQIGMSKSLSTNVGHYHLLWATAELAAEKGLTAESAIYQGWADALKTAIGSEFSLPSTGMLSTFSTTFLDPAPTERYDLLGSALAVDFDVASPGQAESIVAGYPHLPKGPPVLWPQQQDVPIYHNRGIWPFVTALWARAAKQAANAKAVTLATRSLMRGAAINLSNMENFEAVTGAAWLDEGPTSGPVVNSQRQLWSVAGYVSLVHDVLFGLEASQSGIRFAPFVPHELRNTLLAGASRITLSGIPYKGRRIIVALDLPEPTAATEGALAIEGVRLDGTEVGTGFIEAADLGDQSLIEIELVDGSTTADSLTLVDETAIADYRNVFGPRTPTISGITVDADRLRVSFAVPGESASDIAINVYRDGQKVAADLPGSTTSWRDDGSAAHDTRSYCYSVEAYYTGSGNHSQHARPACYWGPGAERIEVIPATSFVANGGTLVFEYGKSHYQGWGDPTHTLTVESFTPSHTGLYYLQLLAGNGAGPFSTGITCAVKRVEVFDGATLVAAGHLMMPHLGTWDDWRESSLLPVSLEAAKSYRIVIGEDPQAVNMSERAHFATYDGTGGTAGRFNRVNVAEVKLLAVDAP